MNICGVCANRLLGCNDFTKFYETVENLPVENEKLRRFVDPSRTCIMCFGFLTRSRFAEYKEEIRKSVENWPLEKEHVVRDFQMLITVPSIMPLVENIVYYSIKQEVSDVVLPGKAR